MIATGVIKGRTVKTVTVIDVFDADTDDDIVKVALDFARETFSSVWNWEVTRYGPIANVRLDTD